MVKQLGQILCRTKVLFSSDWTCDWCSQRGLVIADRGNMFEGFDYKENFFWRQSCRKDKAAVWASASDNLTKAKESKGDQELLQFDCVIFVVLLCLFLSHIGLLFSFRNLTLKSTRNDFLPQRVKHFCFLRNPRPNHSCSCGHWGNLSSRFREPEVSGCDAVTKLEGPQW